MNSRGARQPVFVPTRPSTDLVGSDAGAVIPPIDRVTGPTITNTRTTDSRQALNMSSTLNISHHGHDLEERETPMDSIGTRVASAGLIRSTQFAATARRAIGKRTICLRDPTKRTLSSLARGCLDVSFFNCA